ncbi:transcription factor [Lecanora helva]
MSTPTRRSERKRAVNTRLGDLNSSPTQRAPPPSKKRKATNHAPARPRPPPRTRQKTPEEETAEPNEEPNEETDDETALDDDYVPQDSEIVVPHLTTSKDPVVMSTTHNNKSLEERYGGDEIAAFAQVRGRDWTYYAEEPVLKIGREQALENGEDLGKIKVHIDLGPSKVVSRIHAVVRYGPDEVWHVSCHGRNGVKIDDNDLRQGESRAIHCGSVISVAGTEMLFQVANQKCEIDQRYKDRVVRYDEELNNGGLHNNLSNDRPPYYNASGPSYSGLAHFPQHPPISANHPEQQDVAPSLPAPARQATPPISPPKPAAAASTKKRSPPNRRAINGILMESTEQIDYSLDSSKELKPACSYAAMITWAILSTPDESLSLSGIYDWIKEHYAYYRYASTGWQNSIRHNLSLSASFYKFPRRHDQSGKGMMWALDSTHREATLATANKNLSKGGGRVSSAPGTPAAGPSSSSSFPPVIPNGNAKASPRSRTPPLSSYPPAQQESYTPTRGPQMPAPTFTPQMPAYAPTQGTLPAFSDETSPMPKRRVNGTLTAADSSPILASGGWSTDAPMRTPAPRPHNLNALQPNSIRLPTSHMADSSPAPFFVYNGHASTPAGHWPEISPFKSNGNTAGPGFPSSSPPPPANGLESPTRKPKPPTFGSSQQNGNARVAVDDEDGEIDITKGFTNISSFHQQRSHDFLRRGHEEFPTPPKSQNQDS